MSITLLLFLMLTNASEVNLEDQLKKCGKPLFCFAKNVTIWDFNKELKTEEVDNLSNWAKDASEKIEKMIKNHHYCQIMRIIFIFIVILLIILGFCVYFNKWYEHNVKPTGKETSILDHLHYSTGSVGIILILVGLGIVFFVIFLQIHRTADIKAACKDLKANITAETISAMKNLKNEMEKKVEQNQQEKNPLKAAIERTKQQESTEKSQSEKYCLNKLWKFHDDCNQKHGCWEYAYKNVCNIVGCEKEPHKNVCHCIKKNEQTCKNDNKCQWGKTCCNPKDPAMEYDSTKIDQAVAELTNVYDSKKSAPEMTETTILDQSSKKKQQKDRHNKKNGHENEGIIDDIDLNLFVYPIVILFTVFAICALCNFEREEEIGEITEV